MNYSAIIAVVGTLVGVIVSALLTYFVQRRITERQRKWALEDEERHKQQLFQDEKCMLKRELFMRRLDPIEEAATLMGSILHRAVGAELGLPMSNDKMIIEQAKQRLQEIRLSAWSAIVITGSEELKRHWTTLSSAYWSLEEEGYVASEYSKVLNETHIAITKILDEMRLGD